MNKKLILDQDLLKLTVSRLCQQLIENHANFSASVLLGLQPRGIFLANRIAAELGKELKKDINLGYLDITFYRDDFRRRDTPIVANETQIDFIIENKRVILIDDVLYTGRSVRAALDAMIAFGRPAEVELLVLINRKYGRDLPIEPKYVGRTVNTLESQRVDVGWSEQGKRKDNVWLVNKA
ncbi:MAG TPA: bifunctional pyr operon transcriptional regulator/uracil phosphoribosyltransferase PyrR [Cytophagales bacterium]|jgi:pyrimidine operon attenuation protein/uracil phosphoribosyltransferase|nr:bifunctional pyr operon transcriptional regulator/uracil phosphoribosyltransferase PyrR [Cytophagales bacterium]